MKKVHIGTSGWSYQHWKESFYPKEVKSKEWLHYYGSQFSTVEVNSTFYRLPLETTMETWYGQTPKNFLFSIKASRLITHQKRLKECEERLMYLYKIINLLKLKAGPILFQLPPTFKANRERLVEFVKLLDPDYRHVFEFRDPSWFNTDIYEVLTRYRIALCISDLKGHLSPEEIVTDFSYIRLHGPHDSYVGSYSDRQLIEWQKKIEKWAKKSTVFCYFDNDEKGYATQDARRLINLLGI